MNLSQVHKKLAETDFFLGKMREQEERFVGDKDPFDYYLSAFLSAGRSVDYRLRHEQGALYRPWRATWDAGLSPAENALIKALVDDRTIEAHESGSGRSVGKEGVEFGIGEHRLPGGGGMVTISGPPGMGRPSFTGQPTASISTGSNARQPKPAPPISPCYGAWWPNSRQPIRSQSRPGRRRTILPPA
jgi:hypothetical protein